MYIKINCILIYILRVKKISPLIFTRPFNGETPFVHHCLSKFKAIFFLLKKLVTWFHKATNAITRCNYMQHLTILACLAWLWSKETMWVVFRCKYSSCLQIYAWSSSTGMKHAVAGETDWWCEITGITIAEATMKTY